MEGWIERAGDVVTSWVARTAQPGPLSNDEEGRVHGGLEGPDLRRLLLRNLRGTSVLYKPLCSLCS